ncbi:MAG: hypothetical protein AB7I41_04830 [Candidatus Sericytochromatia bacterium]
MKNPMPFGLLALLLFTACESNPVTPTPNPSPPTSPAVLLLPTPAPAGTPIVVKLSGQVSDDTGRPLVDALVTLQSPGLQARTAEEAQGQDRYFRTDLHGKFSLEVISDSLSTLTISASKPGYSWRSQEFLPRDNENLQLILSQAPFPKGLLALQMTLQEGRPIVAMQKISGGELSLVANDAQEPDWAPTGQKVAVIGKDGLYIADMQAQQAQKILSQTGLSQPRWSPDGKSLLFRREVAPLNGEIFKVSATGGEVTQLTDHPADEGDPSWSADGKFIYFTTNRDAPLEALKPGELRPAGSGFYLRNEVYRAAASDGSGPQRLSQNGVIDRYPSESPGGEQIAFLNAGSILALMQRDGQAYRQLADRNSARSDATVTTPGSISSAPRWSRDGQWLLAVRQVSLNPPRQDVFVFSATGPAFYRLTWSGGIQDAAWLETE